ncbi:hypothetical protein [Photobacterium profundum]|uniref:Uncharacterized protein n=1 Tax=Photobacterium profundum (strain SS9) TaxID=298386 RepID=Q6LFW4_PHOPR|nr:hypothetical protein [Photobacterium profundum]CAG23816.1 hypothetical protein PBPRB1971 [Photobacterium profundum SS9]
MKNRVMIVLATLISFSAMAAISTKKEVSLLYQVKETIFIQKPSLDVEFKQYLPSTMKANMKMRIYWTLYKGLNIQYQCTNVSADIGKDMCSGIRLELATMNPAYPDALILSASNPQIHVPTRTRFMQTPWEAIAYLDLNGLDGGDVKATGTLILSAAI